MLMIIAICMTSVKALRVKSIYVLHFTAGASIFAYIWLFLIVSVFSPGEIKVWEAVVTILYFPLFVFIAWLFDTGRLATGAEFVAYAMPVQRQHKRLAKTASDKLALQLEPNSHLTQVAEVSVKWRRKRRLKKLISEIYRNEPEQTEAQIIEGAIAALRDRHPVSAGRRDDQATTVKGRFGFTESKVSVSRKKNPTLALTIQREELEADPTLEGECYLRLVASSDTAEEGVHFRVMEPNNFHFPAGVAKSLIARIELLETDVYQGRRAFEVTLEAKGQHCHWKNRTCHVQVRDSLRSKTWFGKLFEK
jgi:Ca2+/Na+ antiporter